MLAIKGRSRHLMAMESNSEELRKDWKDMSKIGSESAAPSFLFFSLIYRAAHKAERAAGESSVRNETNVPEVMTDLSLERSGAGKPGCKSPVRSGASEMAGRSGM